LRKADHKLQTANCRRKREVSLISVNTQSTHNKRRSWHTPALWRRWRRYLFWL